MSETLPVSTLPAVSGILARRPPANESIAFSGYFSTDVGAAGQWSVCVQVAGGGYEWRDLVATGGLDNPGFAIYRQGAVNPAAPVYGAFAAALAAAKASGSPAPYVEIDGSIATCTTPAASTFDCSGVTIHIPSSFILGAGSQLQNPARITGPGTLAGNCTTRAAILVSDTKFLILDQDLILTNSSAAHALIDASGGTTHISMQAAVFPAPNNFLDLGIGGDCTLTTVLGSVVSNSTVLGGGGSELDWIFDAGTIIGPQPGFIGLLQPLPLDDSGGVIYSPSFPADWPLAPSAVQGALDELAQFQVDVLLVGGNGTVVTGRNFANAELVSCTLKTPHVAVGAPAVTWLANGHVTVQSYGPNAAALVTDASLYHCVFIGVK